MDIFPILQAAAQTVGSAATKTTATVRQIKDFGVAAFDTVTDTKDVIVGHVEGAIRVGRTTVSLLTTLGLVVAAIAAPVPTFIGITILELMTIYGSHVSSEIAERQDEKKKKRSIERLLSKLAKYGGVIPATALIETSTIKLRLDSVAGTAEGTLKTGFFTTTDLAALTVDQLRDHMPKVDEESAKILDAYLKFRENVN